MYVCSLSIMYEYTIDVFRVAFGRSLPVEQQVPDPLRGFGRDDARGETERRDQRGFPPGTSALEPFDTGAFGVAEPPESSPGIAFVTSSRNPP